MKKTKNSNLKALAADAKNRLSKGYWQEIRVTREQALKEAAALGKDTQNVMQYFSERCEREIAAMSNPIDRKEEEMYRRVKEALERDGEIANPVSLLADPDLLSCMSDSERQRYIFSLTGKYAELKKRYRHEKELLDGINVD